MCCAILTLDWCPRLCRACLKGKYLCVQLRGGLCVLCVWHCLVSAVLYGPGTSTRDGQDIFSEGSQCVCVSVWESPSRWCSILHTAACLSRGLMATSTAYSATLRRCALRPKYHIRQQDQGRVLVDAPYRHTNALAKAEERSRLRKRCTSELPGGIRKSQDRHRVIWRAARTEYPAYVSPCMRKYGEPWRWAQVPWRPTLRAGLSLLFANARPKHSIPTPMDAFRDWIRGQDRFCL